MRIFCFYRKIRPTLPALQAMPLSARSTEKATAVKTLEDLKTYQRTCQSQLQALKSSAAYSEEAERVLAAYFTAVEKVHKRYAKMSHLAVQFAELSKPIKELQGALKAEWINFLDASFEERFEAFVAADGTLQCLLNAFQLDLAAEQTLKMSEQLHKKPFDAEKHTSLQRKIATIVDAIGKYVHCHLQRTRATFHENSCEFSVTVSHEYKGPMVQACLESLTQVSPDACKAAKKFMEDVVLEVIILLQSAATYSICIGEKGKKLSLQKTQKNFGEEDLQKTFAFFKEHFLLEDFGFVDAAVIADVATKETVASFKKYFKEPFWNVLREKMSLKATLKSFVCDARSIFNSEASFTTLYPAASTAESPIAGAIDTLIADEDSLFAPFDPLSYRRLLKLCREKKFLVRNTTAEFFDLCVSYLDCLEENIEVSQRVKCVTAAAFFIPKPKGAILEDCCCYFNEMQCLIQLLQKHTKNVEVWLLAKLHNSSIAPIRECLPFSKAEDCSSARSHAPFTEATFEKLLDVHLEVKLWLPTIFADLLLAEQFTLMFEGLHRKLTRMEDIRPYACQAYAALCQRLIDWHAKMMQDDERSAFSCPSFTRIVSLCTELSFVLQASMQQLEKQLESQYFTCLSLQDIAHFVNAIFEQNAAAERLISFINMLQEMESPLDSQ